jgi:hypothetical protein
MMAACGTVSGYTRGKCRCDACRAAWATYQRAHKKRPAARAWRRQYLQRPEVKAKRAAAMRRYRAEAKMPQPEPPKFSLDDLT